MVEINHNKEKKLLFWIGSGLLLILAIVLVPFHFDDSTDQTMVQNPTQLTLMADSPSTETKTDSPMEVSPWLIDIDVHDTKWVYKNNNFNSITRFPGYLSIRPKDYGYTYVVKQTDDNNFYMLKVWKIKSSYPSNNNSGKIEIDLRDKFRWVNQEKDMPSDFTGALINSKPLGYTYTLEKGGDYDYLVKIWKFSSANPSE